MSRRALVDNPGDGAWIMQRAGGRFIQGYDHSLANHDTATGTLLGGFVVNMFLGNAVFVHNAGITPAWCSRTLMWMLFTYTFRQLRCAKVIAPVAQSNPHSLSLCLRAGFKPEATLADAIAPGVDLLLLAMHAPECRWLQLRPDNPYSSVFVEAA